VSFIKMRSLPGVGLIVDNLPLYIFTLVAAIVTGYIFGSIGKKKKNPVSSILRDDAEEKDAAALNAPPQRVRSYSKILRQPDTELKSVKRVIVVAHSLPARPVKNEDGKYTVVWDDSRNWLSALRMLRNESDKAKYHVTWLGCVDAYKYEDEEIKIIETELKKHDCVPCWIRSQNVRNEYFRGFCKGVLWRLFHYVMPQADPDFGQLWENRWKAYIEVNKLLADVAVAEARPNAEETAIWVHGYAVLLVPEFVRKALPAVRLGMFVHTPWPTTDVVRCLPSRNRILEAMLSSDIVGFHTYDYARHFLSACRRIAGLDFTIVAGGRLGVKTQSGRTVLVEISHLGINTHFFNELSQGEGVIAAVEKIRKEHSGRQIVVGVDHLDLVKGTFIKLQAYRRFLETHGEWKDGVTLLQVLLPSWNPPREQKTIRESLFAEVKAIKENFGEGCIKVVDASSSSLSVEETVAIYRCADAALISTFWDGLNLVPYEFTASQDPERPGVLIISEFMGCSRSLSGALMVNPWSLEDVSDKLYAALEMKPGARKAHHAKRGRYVLNHTTEQWARKFLADLESSKSLQRDLRSVEGKYLKKNFTRLSLDEVTMTSPSTSLEESEDQSASHKAAMRFAGDLKRAKTRIFFLDYDGTLVVEENLEKVDDDTAAEDYTRRVKPSQALLRVLSDLTKDKRNIVFIVSGREKDQLDSWFAHIPDLGLAAEKGCFITWPERLRTKLELPSAVCSESKDSKNKSRWESAMKMDVDWKADVLRLLKAYTDRTDGSYIEAKEVSLSWHYDAADPVFGSNQAAELHRYIEKIVSSSVVDITRYSYHKILEIKPKGINKGATVLRILERINSSKTVDFKASPVVFAAGDEASDERMFEALLLACGKADEDRLKLASTALQAPDVKLTSGSTYTCFVGLRPSSADYFVHEPADIVKLLKRIGSSY